MNEKIKQFKIDLSEMYVAINKGEFTFPEFAGLSKKHKKECSLKAHSIMQRYMRQLEEQDDSSEDQRETS